MNDIRVLIVEDDARIADLHRRFTERVEGYAVVGVALGLAEAADMVASLGPDLVLLDLYFPEGNGMGLLREIRSRCLETDVILITAAREVGPLKDALRHGVCDYIIKPVMAGRFHECLEKYRRRRQRVHRLVRMEVRRRDDGHGVHRLLQQGLVDRKSVV